MIDDGLAVMLKVGGGGDVTVKTTLTLWARLPLAPNTVTVPLSPTRLSEIERIALAVPPGANVTLEGLMDQLAQAGGQRIRGMGDVVRETVPENPLMLVMLMIDVAVVPA